MSGLPKALVRNLVREGIFKSIKNIENAILSVFSQAQIQRCIVHQIRNTLKHVSYKDRKSFAHDLKSIYTAPNKEAGATALNSVKDSWKAKYPYALRSWEVNWNQLIIFYEYIAEIKKVMYTTNMIENVHRQFRKVTKSKGVFPTAILLLKQLCLVVVNLDKK